MCRKDILSVNVLVPATFKVPPACTFFAIRDTTLSYNSSCAYRFTLCCCIYWANCTTCLEYFLLCQVLRRYALLIPTLDLGSTLNTVVKMPLFFTLTSILGTFNRWDNSWNPSIPMFNSAFSP